MTKLSAVIVDDEPLAHNVLLTYSENLPFIEVIGQCYSATEALSLLAEKQVDLLFLDINMPMLTGLDLLRVLKQKPQIIITSAHQEYALDSFEFDVTDYLLKPFSFERCLQACNKVLKRFELLQQANRSQQQPAREKDIIVKVDKKQFKLNLDEISCFEAYGNYVKVWHHGKSLLTARTLASFEQQLPTPEFIQIHRSVIVNLQHIEYIEGSTVRLKDGNSYNVGKSFKRNLTANFG